MNQEKEFEQKHAKLAKMAAASTPLPRISFIENQAQGIYAVGAIIYSFAVFVCFCSKFFFAPNSDQWDAVELRLS
ncbi:MAG: hypothetical protein WCO42_10910 [bacterium]